MGMIAIGAYRVHEGHEEDFLEALRQDIVTMRDEGLISDWPAMILKAGTDVFLQVVEWADDDAPARSSSSEQVMAVWTRKRTHANYVSLSQVPGADRLFPSFEEIPTR
ncbi:MAG: antibiotic biosynthesis monooxygenase [Acidimicrobiia bacterium]